MYVKYKPHNKKMTKPAKVQHAATTCRICGQRSKESICFSCKKFVNQMQEREKKK